MRHRGSDDRASKNGDCESTGNRTGPSAAMWKLAGMGFELAGAVAGFTLIGWWADRAWQTSPRYTIAGVVLGLIGGMYNFIRRSLIAARDADQAARERDDSGGQER